MSNCSSTQTCGLPRPFSLFFFRLPALQGLSFLLFQSRNFVHQPSYLMLSFLQFFLLSHHCAGRQLIAQTLPLLHQASWARHCSGNAHTVSTCFRCIPQMHCSSPHSADVSSHTEQTYLRESAATCPGQIVPQNTVDVLGSVRALETYLHTSFYSSFYSGTAPEIVSANVFCSS